MKQKFAILFVALVVAIMFEAVLCEDGSGGESGPDGGYHYEHHGDNSYGYGFSGPNGGGGGGGGGSSPSGSNDENGAGFDWGWVGQWFNGFGWPRPEHGQSGEPAEAQE
ncbi:uncharacterized protein [Musca autumnalis]|uniref:uncharacterized protein n=1 Tax=Musca autumnalis TaxID=221902 RepID=UPI003CF04C8D